MFGKTVPGKPPATGAPQPVSLLFRFPVPCQPVDNAPQRPTNARAVPFRDESAACGRRYSSLTVRRLPATSITFTRAPLSIISPRVTTAYRLLSMTAVPLGRRALAAAPSLPSSSS